MSFLGEWSEVLELRILKASGKVPSWLLQLSIDSLIPEKKWRYVCITPMVKSCYSYIGSVLG